MGGLRGDLNESGMLIEQLIEIVGCLNCGGHRGCLHGFLMFVHRSLLVMVILVMMISDTVFNFD